MNKKDSKYNFTERDIQNGKFLSIISYVWLLALIPFLTSNNKYILYHSKQGIRLSIIYTIILIILIPLNKIEIFWKITDILIPLTLVFALTISLVGMYDVIKGKARELPFINKIFKGKQGVKNEKECK